MTQKIHQPKGSNCFFFPAEASLRALHAYVVACGSSGLVVPWLEGKGSGILIRLLVAVSS